MTATGASSWTPGTRTSSPRTSSGAGGPQGNQQARLPLARRHPVAGFDHDAFMGWTSSTDGHDPKDDRIVPLAPRPSRHKTAQQDRGDPRPQGPRLGGRDRSPQEHEPRPRSTTWTARTHAVTNACNQFIPQMVSHPIIREKFVLQIMDGIRGVYQGGPFGRERRQVDLGIQRGALRDRPVAMDHVEWHIVDAKRKT